jgi:predicted TPR repeat methyltransferase
LADTIIGDFNCPETFRSFQDGRPKTLTDSSYDLAISAGAVSEYGNLEKVIPQAYRMLRKGGLLVNIGVSDTLFNKVSAVVWHYRPNGAEIFKKACEASGFTEIREENIPKRYFPTNYLKYAVTARK